MLNKLIYILIFLGILYSGFYLRSYNTDWDGGQHLHPDERFLTMVTTGIDWPKNVWEYLDTPTSPLNPHNRGFGFYVYGTFPVFFTKWIGDIFKYSDYGKITVAGRYLSALIDTGTLLLVFFIARKIGKSKTVIFPLLAMFLYAMTTLSIQISHFYAVDTYLTFFITLSFYLLAIAVSRTNKMINIRFFMIYILLGISFGLALASKISAALFLAVIFMGFILSLIKNRNIIVFVFGIAVFFGASYFTLRLAQPYLFAHPDVFDVAINTKVLDNWKELARDWKPDSGFPPSIQWFYITPLIFPLRSFVLWGMGLPLGILAIIGILCAIIFFMKILIFNFRKKQFINPLKAFLYLCTKPELSIFLLMVLWSSGLFIYQGIQPAPSIRYFHPIYPFMCIITSYFIYHYISNKSVTAKKIFLAIILTTSSLWPLSFFSIYQKPHSRVLASEWIYQNIPKGSSIAIEHWDDGLPLSLDGQRIHEFYKFIEFPLYNQDSPEKWQKMTESLYKTDYIAETSNRLWASLTRVPDKFPVTAHYYNLLFGGKLGFVKVAEVTSYPFLDIPVLPGCLYVLPPQETFLGLFSDKQGYLRYDSCSLYKPSVYRGIVFRDESSEETFTVYDHPKVMIFRNEKRYSSQKLLEIITSQKE